MTISIDVADSEVVVRVTAAVDESKPLVAVSINMVDPELMESMRVGADESKPLMTVVSIDELDSELMERMGVVAGKSESLTVGVSESLRLVRVTAVIDESKPLVVVSINEVDSVLI